MLETKHTEEQLFVSLGYISPLLQFVRLQGKPIEPLLNLLGLEESDLNCSDLRLPDSVIDELYLGAEQLCHDPNIGMHAGQCMGLSNIGIIGHLIMTCTKASQIMSLHTRYQTLQGNGAFSEYVIDLDKVCLHFRRVEGAQPFQRHYSEFCLAGWISLISLVAGKPMRPELIEFPCEPPKDMHEQLAFFACELKYVSGNEMRIHFPRHYLEHALMGSDSSVREALETLAKQRLKELQGSFSNDSDLLLPHVTRFVRDALPHGLPSIETMARHLSISVRSLQRQLEIESMTYKTLVDGVRRELCGHYILNYDLSLADVALMLGFSEQSSFQRAFKRWFEVTPGEYRLSKKEAD
ncbi:AraC family transcriptional regulator ligand-binding domain-containing protein [Paraperlucidibaca wandonensis]|uniref:AraC family transcriptional regulator ligand-binding domain-containing protein n=1 Tax=Paraperlucidibaca wandonensis TaxID=1268273 RepID=A0ABW3HH86_9GAMM